MSNENESIDDRSLPTNWEKELAESAKAAAATERPNLSAISLRGGIMMLNKVQVPGNKLKAIIVGSIMEHVWYEKDFDPNRPASPACFAFHDGTDGIPWTPHPKSALPQSELCQTCPKWQWGSDRKGGKGKDCKEKRKMAIIPAGASGKEMALLSVPVMSVKNWSNYVNEIAQEYKRPPWGMITEIFVHPDARSQFTVEFTALEPVPNEGLAAIYSRIPLAMDVLTAPYDYQNPQETLGDPNGGPQKKKKY